MAEGDKEKPSTGNSSSPNIGPAIYFPSSPGGLDAGGGTKTPAPSQPEPEGRRPAPQKDEPGSSAKQ